MYSFVENWKLKFGELYLYKGKKLGSFDWVTV